MEIRSFPKWSLWLCIICSIVVLGWIDLITGHEFDFFIFYFLPVGAAAWLFGLAPAMAVTIICTMVWFSANFLSGAAYSSHIHAVWNSSILLSALLIVAWLVDKINKVMESQRRSAEALQRSLSEIKILEGMLSICAQCKKIRDENGHWQQMEIYIRDRSKVEFSHGFCPECARKWLEDAGLTMK